MMFRKLSIVALVGICAAGCAKAAPGNSAEKALKQAPPIPTNGAAISITAPPMPPVGKSPVAIFRELLAMTPQERREALNNRSPETRKQILAKIREYESLKPTQRELKLVSTELRWYMLNLMATAPSNRMDRMAEVPAEMRRLVTERLAAWDKLTTGDQMALLTNQATLQYFSEPKDQSVPENLSPERAARLQEGIQQWQQLTDAEQEAIKKRFNQFFQLTPDEQERSLYSLSDSEKKQIERTLRSFRQLAPQERATCLESFDKFANLSVEERQQFLKNAERWKRMTPDERKAWRDLVTKLHQPPLPPGLQPPEPPGPARRGGPSLTTTNP